MIAHTCQMQMQPTDRLQLTRINTELQGVPVSPPFPSYHSPNPNKCARPRLMPPSYICLVLHSWKNKLDTAQDMVDLQGLMQAVLLTNSHAKVMLELGVLQVGQEGMPEDAAGAFESWRGGGGWI
jgi:hypothetical protein